MFPFRSEAVRITPYHAGLRGVKKGKRGGGGGSGSNVIPMRARPGLAGLRPRIRGGWHLPALSERIVALADHPESWVAPVRPRFLVGIRHFLLVRVLRRAPPVDQPRVRRDVGELVDARGRERVGVLRRRGWEQRSRRLKRLGV